MGACLDAVYGAARETDLTISVNLPDVGYASVIDMLTNDPTFVPAQ